MFFLRRPSLQSSGIFSGSEDFHSHILPGVDDGVKTMKEALEVLGLFESLGVRTLWCTPHIMEDIPNRTEDLKARFRELCDAYTGSIRLHLAAEYMMDSVLKERLGSGDLLPHGENGDRLLVETSYFTSPIDMDQILDAVFSAGYFPVLAHPERYVYMDRRRYEELHERGVEFQMNILSAVGAYGSAASKNASWLCKKGYVNYRGSDLHSLRSLQNNLDKKMCVKI